MPAVSAAILAAGVLTAPLMAAHAQANSAMSEHASKAATQEETVEQRIATLRSELKITPAEENDWNAVAQTMRDNAAAMEKLANDKAAQSQQTVTAVQDLQTYAEFAQAHVDHLKLLTERFQTLYNMMPEQQRKRADQVFEQSHRAEQNNQG